MSKTKLVKAASLIMILTLVSKVMGFLRDSLIAASFGATYQTDAYNIAITIPEILFAVFSLAITTTFIPILSEVYENKGKNQMFKFSNNIMNILLVILIILCILGSVFSPELVKIIAPTYTGQKYNLTVTLVRISVLNIVFMGINGGYNSILQTMNDFTAPALVGIMLNVPIILYILLGIKGGVIGLTISTVIGNIMKIVIQIPWIHKSGYKPKIIFDFKDKRIKKMFLLIVPVILGAGINQVNAIVDKSIASGLQEGSISALSFSSKITDVVYITFAVAIVTVIYPTLSKEASCNNMINFKLYISKGINNINLIMIPSTFILIVLSKPIVTLLFKHGIFNNRGVVMTSIALIYYSVGLPFYGIRDMLNRALYALNDTKTSTINGIIGVSINILFNIVLSRYMGIGGLALATSIAAISCTFLLANSLKKRVGTIVEKKVVITGLKIVIVSAVMSIFVFLVYNSIFNLITGVVGNLVGLVISGIIGAGIYIVGLKIFKVEEINDIIYILKIKMRLKR